MSNSELHVEAGLWRGMAVLVMEGEATDRAGRRIEDALYRVVLARGLRLATDVDQLDPRPVRGWRLVVDRSGAVTLTWPHRTPLLTAAPLDLPPGWREALTTRELVEVFVGYGQNMHDPNAHPLHHLHETATRGALAAAPIPASLPDAYLPTPRVSPVQAAELPVRATTVPVQGPAPPVRAH